MSKKSDFFSKYFFIIVYLIFVVGLIIVSNIYFLEASNTDNRGLDYIGEAIAKGIFMLAVIRLFFIIVPVIVSIVFIIRYVGLNINENTKSSIVCVLKTISSYFIYYSISSLILHFALNIDSELYMSRIFIRYISVILALYPVGKLLLNKERLSRVSVLFLIVFIPACNFILPFFTNNIYDMDFQLIILYSLLEVSCLITCFRPAYKEDSYKTESNKISYIVFVGSIITLIISSLLLSNVDNYIYSKDIDKVKNEKLSDRNIYCLTPYKTKDNSIYFTVSMTSDCSYEYSNNKNDLVDYRLYSVDKNLNVNFVKYMFNYLNDFGGETDYLYYISDRNLYKLLNNNESEKLFNNVYISDLAGVYDNKFYYEENYGDCTTIDISTGELNTKVNFDCRFMPRSMNEYYFVNEGDTLLKNAYFINKKTNEKIWVDSFNKDYENKKGILYASDIIDIYNDELYYTNITNKHIYLRKINMRTGVITDISELNTLLKLDYYESTNIWYEKRKTIIIRDNYLYYSNRDDSGLIYKINLDTLEKEKVNNIQNSYPYDVIDDYLYYTTYSSDKTTSFYRIKDGINEIIVE